MAWAYLMFPFCILAFAFVLHGFTFVNITHIHNHVSKDGESE